MLTKGTRCLKCTHCICFGLGTDRTEDGVCWVPDSSALTHSTGRPDPQRGQCTLDSCWRRRNGSEEQELLSMSSGLQSQARWELQSVPACGLFRQHLSPSTVEVGKVSFSTFSVKFPRETIKKKSRHYNEMKAFYGILGFLKCNFNAIFIHS